MAREEANDCDRYRRASTEEKRPSRRRPARLSARVFKMNAEPQASMPYIIPADQARKYDMRFGQARIQMDAERSAGACWAGVFRLDPVSQRPYIFILRWTNISS